MPRHGIANRNEPGVDSRKHKGSTYNLRSAVIWQNLERSGYKVYVRKVINNVKELLEDDGVENIWPILESHKITLKKQQQKIEVLNQEIAQPLEVDAIEKEILERCEFEGHLQETISLISAYLSTLTEAKALLDETMLTPLSIRKNESPKPEKPHHAAEKSSGKTKLPKLSTKIYRKPDEMDIVLGQFFLRYPFK